MKTLKKNYNQKPAAPAKKNKNQGNRGLQV